MVKTKTMVKVPIIEVGVFGEKGKQVRIEMIKK
jgi:hypothetical protein